ncbi:hypothetical protein B0H14DRAFT_3533941 [Mycena olivaceomarginata]|nr:hypothetical protein B0H14DRAFT_3533941 [Mycena olivaceomarginata]
MAKYLVHLSFTSTNTILAPGLHLLTSPPSNPLSPRHWQAPAPPNQRLSRYGLRPQWRRQSRLAPCLNTSTAITAAADGSVTLKVQNFNAGADGSTSISVEVDQTGMGKKFVTGNGNHKPSKVETDQVTFSLPAGTKCAGGKAKNLCLVSRNDPSTQSVKTTGGFGACTVPRAATSKPTAHPHAHHMRPMNTGAEDSTVLLWLRAVTKRMNTLFSKQLEDRVPLRIKKGETWLQTVKGSVPLNKFLLYNLFSNLVHTFFQVDWPNGADEEVIRRQLLVTHGARTSLDSSGLQEALRPASLVACRPIFHTRAAGTRRAESGANGGMIDVISTRALVA